MSARLWQTARMSSKTASFRCTAGGDVTLLMLFPAMVHRGVDLKISIMAYRLYVRLLGPLMATAAVTTFVATAQGHPSSPFDLENTTAEDQLPGFSCDITWPPTSVSVKLLPVDELRATVSDRKHFAVHVTVGVDEVAPPRGGTTNCENTTEHGYSRIL